MRGASSFECPSPSHRDHGTCASRLLRHFPPVYVYGPGPAPRGKSHLAEVRARVQDTGRTAVIPPVLAGVCVCGQWPTAGPAVPPAAPAPPLVTGRCQAHSTRATNTNPKTVSGAVTSVSRGCGATRIASSSAHRSPPQHCAWAAHTAIGAQSEAPCHAVAVGRVASVSE